MELLALGPEDPLLKAWKKKVSELEDATRKLFEARRISETER